MSQIYSGCVRLNGDMTLFLRKLYRKFIIVYSPGSAWYHSGEMECTVAHPDILSSNFNQMVV